MKKVTTFILLTALVAVSSSCKKDIIGEGPIVTETRAITGFSGIDLQMNGNVYYKNEPDWKVEVSAKQSIHGILETKLVNNKLVIRYHNGKTYDNDESIRINVSGPLVNSFSVNTSGNIYVVNGLESNHLFLRSSGSGDISMQHVITSVLDAETTTSGRISSTGGWALSEKLRTNGSGVIDVSATDAKTATARIIGSGDIRVKVSERLEARIDGSGSIYFRGTPLISTDINGTGRIVRF